MLKRPERTRRIACGRAGGDAKLNACDGACGVSGLLCDRATPAAATVIVSVALPVPVVFVGEYTRYPTVVGCLDDAGAATMLRPGRTRL